MIIKGRARADGTALAKYLLKEHDRQEARIIDRRDHASPDLGEVLTDWEETAKSLTKGQKTLYHSQIRLADGEHLTREQWMATVNKLEKKLGLDSCPRTIVGHKLDGQLHLHVVWSRLDLGKEKLVHMGYDTKKHHEVARAAEKEFGLRQLKSNRHKPREKTQDRENSRQRDVAHKQAKRMGISHDYLKKKVTAAFMASNSPAEFDANLLRMGLHLGNGNKRDYVIVSYGIGTKGERETFNPVRFIPGMTAEKFRQKMNGYNPGDLPETDRERRSREKQAREAATPKRKYIPRRKRIPRAPQPQLKPRLYYGDPGI